MRRLLAPNDTINRDYIQTEAGGSPRGPAGRVNNGILTEKDFVRTKRAKQPVIMTDEGRKRFIEEYEGKINTTVAYPLTGEKTSYRRCFELQVRQLAHCITGKKEYQPMTIK